MKYILGVDEAGRGPLAGPVAVGIVATPKDFDVLREFPDVRDSKVLLPERREAIYKRALEYKKRGDIRFTVRFSDHLYIDTFGITKAVRRGVSGGVKLLARDPGMAKVYLDGLLQAPSGYEQETVIHGDALVPIISLASILAKVERDRLMARMSKKYPGYGFERHKGYGTRAHREALHALGMCEIHRRTYCKMVQSPVPLAADRVLSQ